MRGSRAGDALAVQRVRHHLARAHQPVERPAFGEGDRVAQGEAFLQRAVGRHAVVHPARKLADLGVKRAAKRHVHLLKATADAQEGLAPVDAGADQRQRDRIPAPVKGTMGGGFLLAIFAGVDVRAAPGQQEPVAQLQQLLDRDIARIGRDDQRQAARNLGHGGRIHRAAGMHRVAVIDQVAVADDPDHRPSARNPHLRHRVRRLRLSRCKDRPLAPPRKGAKAVLRAQRPFSHAQSPRKPARSRQNDFPSRLGRLHLCSEPTFRRLDDPSDSPPLPQRFSPGLPPSAFRPQQKRPPAMTATR